MPSPLPACLHLSLITSTTPLEPTLPLAHCPQVEARLRQLEGKQVGGEAAKPRGLPGAEKYDAARTTGVHPSVP